MKAFVIDHYAHPSKHVIAQDVPEPAPAGLKSAEVLVDVYSAGLNFFDVCPTFLSAVLAV
jgi:NADPH2:quinone reductase